MKELWTANPFHLMNRPFAEMGYNSSGLNIAPRAPSVGNSPAFHAPPACFRRTILRPSAHHPPTHHKPCNTRHNIWRPPASHLPSFCVASDGPLHSIRHLAARHPLPCAASVGSLQAICPPVHRAIPASPSQAICRRSAHHLATPCKPSAISLRAIRRPPRVIRWHPAGICWHEPTPLTTRRTNRRRKQEP